MKNFLACIPKNRPPFVLFVPFHIWVTFLQVHCFCAHLNFTIKHAVLHYKGVHCLLLGQFFPCFFAENHIKLTHEPMFRSPHTKSTHTRHYFIFRFSEVHSFIILWLKNAAKVTSGAQTGCYYFYLFVSRVVYE